MVQQLTLDDLTKDKVQEVSSTPTVSKAAQFVRDGLTSCLPPGVPLMGEIVSAKFTGKEKARATLLLFDGRTGVVEVSKWTTKLPCAWAKQWIELEGGALNWNGSAWERIPHII